MILPIDLILQPGDSYACGNLISPDSEILANPCQSTVDLGKTPIRSVQEKSHVIARLAFIKPELDPDNNVRRIRRVLRSCVSFSLKKVPGEINILFDISQKRIPRYIFGICTGGCNAVDEREDKRGGGIIFSRRP